MARSPLQRGHARSPTNAKTSADWSRATNMAHVVITAIERVGATLSAALLAWACA
jgi:hypothetical protein